MNKLRKKHMTKFDYRMRLLIVFAVLIFAVAAIVIRPYATSNETKNNEIQEKLVLKQKEIDTAKSQLDDLLDNETAELVK